MARWSHIGAYAWVENLVPAPPGETMTLPDGRVVPKQRHGGGFVHAPSMAHAATAAVLRSAYLTHEDEGAESARRYAFDLTSARVRAARALLDGVREGQPIGALLGYRFERFLHERALELYLESFRVAFPLLANKSGDPTTEAEHPPRDVVDGLALRTAWRASPDATLDKAGVPTEDRSLLAPAFADLDDAVDGVSDLLTAEGVYQLTRGNAAATSASLDALAAGLRPPDPEIARTPRGGIPVTHRVLWLAAGPPPPPPPVPPPTSRAEVSPQLDAWVDELLGQLDSVRCWARRGTDRWPITLADLDLGALDILELSRATGAVPLELERRIRRKAPDLGAPPEAEIVYEPVQPGDLDRSSMRTFPELLELARHIGELLAQARPLTARDLALLDGGDVEIDDPLADRERQLAVDVGNWARARRDAINAAIPLGDATIRTSLEQATAILPEAFPIAGAGGELATFATSIAAELSKRIDQSQRELDRLLAPHPPPTAAEKIAAATAAIKAILGDSFVRLLPFQLTSAIRTGLGDVNGRSDALLAPDPEAPSRLVQQMARVRPGMAAWRKLWLFAQATLRGTGAGQHRLRPTLRVAQLPYAATESWVGGDFAEDGGPAGSRLSLLIHGSRAGVPDLLAPGGTFAGLVVDDWIELVPSAEEQTGVAFHYDDPAAEAAQTLLIAVPPEAPPAGEDEDEDEVQFWSFAHLVAAVRETFELAKIRAVEPEALGDWGQVLPAIYLSANTRTEPAPSPGDTTDKADDVSTRFDGLLTDEPPP